MDNETIFNQEIDQMIRSVAELAFNNGYNIQDVKEAIDMRYKNIQDRESEHRKIVYNFSELEEKLYQLFDPVFDSFRYHKCPGRKVPEKIRRECAMLCALYFEYRSENENVTIGDFGAIAAQKLNIKLSTVKGSRLGDLAWAIHEGFLKDRFSVRKRRYVPDCLELFYQHYRKNLV